MNNVGLRQVRAFVEVASAGSFRMAAQRLHVSQPALTATIKELEAQLSLRLFDRTTRRVQLTEPAVRFLPVAKRLLLDFDQAVANARREGQYEAGHVLIAITGSVFAWLEPAIAEFVRERPRISLLVRDGGARGPQHQVAMGEVDFAVANVMELDPMLEQEHLLTDRFGILCRPGHPFATGALSPTWDALTKECYVGLASEVGVGTILRNHPSLPAQVRTAHHEAANPVLLRVLLQATNGISVLPQLTARLSTLAGFVYIPLEDPVVERDVFLIRRKDRSLSPAAADLAQRIRDSAAHHG